MKDWMKRFGGSLNWPVKISGNNRGSVSDPFGDYDGDGVPNMNDCEPKNPKKQDSKLLSSEINKQLVKVPEGAGSRAVIMPMPKINQPENPRITPVVLPTKPMPQPVPIRQLPQPPTVPKAVFPGFLSPKPVESRLPQLPKEHIGKQITQPPQVERQIPLKPPIDHTPKQPVYKTIGELYDMKKSGQEITGVLPRQYNTQFEKLNRLYDKNHVPERRIEQLRNERVIVGWIKSPYRYL